MSEPEIDYEDHVKTLVHKELGRLRKDVLSRIRKKLRISFCAADELHPYVEAYFDNDDYEFGVDINFITLKSISLRKLLEGEYDLAENREEAQIIIDAIRREAERLQKRLNREIREWDKEHPPGEEIAEEPYPTIAEKNGAK